METKDNTTSHQRQAALDYHEFPKPGKLEIRATKRLDTGRDLARAYSPGVAEACHAIAADPIQAMRFTAKGNLVAVISNGTAVLGLGEIGAQASKPVMEGKAVLFKKFAGVDCFDIEVNESDPELLAELVCKLEPTFGAVNLEDIKAPDCFTVERICHERMNIPVFHDDQHGTAIVVAAAASNALILTNRRPEKSRVVAMGAGAAGVACLSMLTAIGMKAENFHVFDRDGVLHAGRKDLCPEQMQFALSPKKLTLEDALDGADMFLGLSGPGLLPEKFVAKMAKTPIIFALANPIPEIMPELAQQVLPGALIATGRSDYPNQVNNVLCFPFIFRGALDVAATRINSKMKLACVEAIAGLAREAPTLEVGKAYKGKTPSFGPDYLIPRPFDPRLLPRIALAVAKAAMETGVAKKPINLNEYKESLEGQVYRSSLIMRPVFEAATQAKRRIVFAEGEDTRVLHAAQAMVDESVDTPILIGRPDIIQDHLKRTGLAIQSGQDFEIVNPGQHDNHHAYCETYHQAVERKGVTPDLADAVMRTNTTAIASVMVAHKDADSLVCGTFGQYNWHLKYVSQLLAVDGFTPIGALSLIILDSGPLFVADTQVNTIQTSKSLMETVIATARHVRRFSLTPKIALCSASEFGNQDSMSGQVIRDAIRMLDQSAPNFEYEGEMHTDTALDAELRDRIMPDNRLSGKANTLIYANIDAAEAARNLLKTAAGGLEVGPILMGMGNRAHIVTPKVTARGLLNITALAGSDLTSYG